MSDIIKFDFEGNNLLVIEYNGQKCWVASQVARVIGYTDPRTATGKITGRWSEEFEEGIDYDIIKGSELTEIKELLVAVGKTQTAQYISQLTILYESGFNTLCILSKTPAGKRLRRWLAREVLPSLRDQGTYSLSTTFDIPANFEEALLLAAKQERERKQLTAKIEEDKPKVQFANDVGQLSEDIPLGDFAKALNNDGLRIGRNRLFAWLKKNNYLIHNNRPYQRYVDAGWFVLTEGTRETKSGNLVPWFQTKITGRGQLAIAKKLRECGRFTK